MIIWLLALVLFACFGYVGFCFGAIRMLGSLVGVFVGALLAFPLGHIFNSILGLTGAKNPVLVWLLGPLLVFIVVLIIFKVIGVLVHQKVDLFYKYKGGDLKMGLFNRLNARLGISVGVANAAAYLILLSWVIFAFSYWTNQMVSGDNVAWSVRMLNSAGKNLQDSGMAKAAAAIDPLPTSYYQAADIVGMIYHNDLLEGRLSRYPAFLALGERSEFQEIGSDKEFTELRQRQPPIAEILNYPKAQNIINNPDMLKEIWGIVLPNLADLQAYLKTGQSAKYDVEKILGRWDFDLNAAVNLVKRTKPNIGLQEMQRTKQYMTLSFASTTFVATPEPDRLAFLKNIGKVRPAAKPNLPPTVDDQSFKGQWSSDAGKYQLNFPDRGQTALEAVVEGDRLTVNGDAYPMVFNRQY